MMPPEKDSARYNARAQEMRQHQRGFTILEILIAISIMTIVLTTAYSALSSIMRTKNFLDDERDVRKIASSVLLRLSRELQLITARSLLPPVPEADNKQAKPYLYGENIKLPNGEHGDLIRFSALEGGQYLPDGGTHTGLVQIEYRVAPDPDSPEDQKRYLLIRDELPRGINPEESYKKRMTFPITNSIVALSFQYCQKNSETMTCQWVQEWGGTNFKLGDAASDKLPSLIKYSLKFRSNNGQIMSFSTIVPIRE